VVCKIKLTTTLRFFSPRQTNVSCGIVPYDCLDAGSEEKVDEVFKQRKALCFRNTSIGLDHK